MSFMGAISGSGQAVREERRARILRARLVRRGGTEEDLVIRNVTHWGIGASTRGPAPVRGERVSVILPGETGVRGLVRWFNGKSFGMELDRPTDLEALAEALQRQIEEIQTSRQWEVERKHRVVTPQPDLSRIRRL